MDFILKNNLDRIIRYLLGSLLLLLSLGFLFIPQSKDAFEIFELSETARLVLGYGVSLAALLFIIERTKQWGAIGLLISFVFTAYFHIRVGLNPWGLIIWVAGIIFVLYFDKKRKELAAID